MEEELDLLSTAEIWTILDEGLEVFFAVELNVVYTFHPLSPWFPTVNFLTLQYPQKQQRKRYARVKETFGDRLKKPTLGEPIVVLQDDAPPCEDEEVNNPQCGEQDNN